MMNLNATKLETVIQQAFDAATAQGGKHSRRWQTAIARAKQELENNPFLHFDGDAVLILSPSNQIYRSNGVCQCEAFRRSLPCWHRALARIVVNYHRQQAGH